MKNDNTPLPQSGAPKDASLDELKKRLKSIGQNFVILVMREPRSRKGTDSPLNGQVKPEEIESLDLGMQQGGDPLLADKEGKTPLEYLMSDTQLQPKGLFKVFSVMADYGYYIPDLLQQYAAHPATPKTKELFEQSQESCREQLRRPTALAILWDAKDNPSRFLLSACGHGVLSTLFEQPHLQKNTAEAVALYQKMEQKLPPQCQKMLRTGMDTSFLRDAEQPRQPAALAEALKRTSSAPKGKGDNSPAGGR